MTVGLSLLALTAYIAVIWALVRLIVPKEYFVAAPIEHNGVDAYAEEEQIMRNELEDSKTEEGINFKPVSFDKGLPETERRSLADLGVAENHTIACKDNDNKHPGDFWPCDNRWGWFCVLAWLICLLPVLLLGFIPGGIVYALLLPLPVILVVSVFLALVSYTIVKENVRVGIQRFGDQLDGFLGEGLQFVLPFGIEDVEDVPLQNLVWGPQSEGAGQDSLHIGGTMSDTHTNPSPGKFHVSLGGRWVVTIIVVVTLRVRREFKGAWYDYLNEYVSITEIGEALAAIIGAILSTAAREVQERDVKVEAGEEMDEIEGSVNMLTFLNQLPEISANTLLALHQVGRTRLAGILPVSVAISAEPSEEFRQVLQQIDEAKVHRLVERIRGEATRERVQKYLDLIQALGADDRAMLLKFDYNDVLRSWNSNDGGQGEDLSRLIKAFTADKLRRQQPS